jgi:hypothetical protein
LSNPETSDRSVFREETDDSVYADKRNFYKVEKWTRDGTKVDRLLYAGNNLEKARELFVEAVKHRPRIRLTIRQRTRVLDSILYSSTGLGRHSSSRCQQLGNKIGVTTESKRGGHRS